ncbi:MAG: hypothetical protein WDW38_006720 [Sanguina aurantia]
MMDNDGSHTQVEGRDEADGSAEVKLARFQQLYEKISKGAGDLAITGEQQSSKTSVASSQPMFIAALAAAATPTHHQRSLSGPGYPQSLHRPSVAWAEGVFARAVLPAAAPGSPTVHHIAPRPAVDNSGLLPTMDEGVHPSLATRLFAPRSATSRTLSSGSDQQRPADQASLSLQVQRLQNQLTYTQAREDELEAAQQKQLHKVHEKLATANEQQRMLQAERWQVLEAMSTAAGSSMQVEREKQQIELQKSALQYEAAALEEDRRALGKLSAAVQLEPSLTPANLRAIHASCAQLQQCVLPIIAHLQQRSSDRPTHSPPQPDASSHTSPLTDEQAAIDLLSQLAQLTPSPLASADQATAGVDTHAARPGAVEGGLHGASLDASLGQPRSAAAAAAAGQERQQQEQQQQNQQQQARLAARDVALAMLRQQGLLQRLLTHLLPVMQRDGQRILRAGGELAKVHAHVTALDAAREQMMGQLNISLPSLVQRCEALTAENAALRSDGKALKLRVKEKLGVVAGHNLALTRQLAAQQAALDTGDATRVQLLLQVQALHRKGGEDAAALQGLQERERAALARAETAQRAARDAGVGLADAESQVLAVAEAAAEAQEGAAEARTELAEGQQCVYRAVVEIHASIILPLTPVATPCAFSERAHSQLAQWQSLHDIKVASMRDAMALQLQTVVSAYSEELAALQGQMLQMEGMGMHDHDQGAGLSSAGPGSGRLEAEAELLHDADKREGLLETTQQQVESLKIQISNLGALDLTHQQHIERLSLQMQADRQQQVAEARQQAATAASATAAAAEAAAATLCQQRFEHEQGIQAAGPAFSGLQALHGKQLAQAVQSASAAQVRTAEAEAERDTARAQLQALLLQLECQAAARGQATHLPPSLAHPPSLSAHALPVPSSSHRQTPPRPVYNIPTFPAKNQGVLPASRPRPSELHEACTESGETAELDSAHQQTVHVLELISDEWESHLHSPPPPHRGSSPSGAPAVRHSHPTARTLPDSPERQVSSHDAGHAGGIGPGAADPTQRSVAGNRPHAKPECVLGTNNNNDDTNTTNNNNVQGAHPGIRPASAAALAEELSLSRSQLEAYKAKYARQSVRQASLQQALLDISGDLALGAAASLPAGSLPAGVPQDVPPIAHPSAPPSSAHPHASPCHAPRHAHPQPQLDRPPSFSDQLAQPGQRQGHAPPSPPRESYHPPPQHTPTRNSQDGAQQLQQQQLQQLRFDDLDSLPANAHPPAGLQSNPPAPLNTNKAPAAPPPQPHPPTGHPDVTAPTHPPAAQPMCSSVGSVPLEQFQLDLSMGSTSAYPPPPLYPNSWKAAADAAVARITSNGNSLAATPQRPSRPPASSSSQIADAHPHARPAATAAGAGSQRTVLAGDTELVVQGVLSHAATARRVLLEREAQLVSRQRRRTAAPHPERAHAVAGRHGGWGPGTGSDDGSQTATDAEEGGDGGGGAPQQRWECEGSGGAQDGCAVLEEDDPTSCTDREHEGSSRGGSRDGSSGGARPWPPHPRHPPPVSNAAASVSVRVSGPPRSSPRGRAVKAGADSVSSESSSPEWMRRGHAGAAGNDGGSNGGAGRGGGAQMVGAEGPAHAAGAVVYGPARVIHAQVASGSVGVAGVSRHAHAGSRRPPPSAPDTRQAWSAQPIAAFHLPQQEQQQQQPQQQQQQQRSGEAVSHPVRRGGGETADTPARSVPMDVMRRSAEHAGVEGVARPATAQPSDFRRNTHPPAAPSEVLRAARLFMGEEGTTRPITATPSAMQVVRVPATQPAQQGQQPPRLQQQQQQQQQGPPMQAQQQQQAQHHRSGGGGASGGRASNGSGMDGPPVPLAVMQHAAQFYGLNPATAQPQGAGLTLRTQHHPHPHPYHHQQQQQQQPTQSHARQAQQHDLVGAGEDGEEEQGESEEGAFQQAWTQQQRQQQQQQVHVIQTEAQAPKSVVRRAKQYAGEEGGARPSTASPSSMRPQQGVGAREPEAPDAVLRIARQVTGAEGATDGRPVSAAASSRASNPNTREIPVPRGLLMYIQQYASGQEGDSRPKTASPSVLQPQPMPEMAAPMLVRHMAAQFQAGGEGVTRPTTAPSSDERRSSAASSPHANPRASASTSPLQPLNLRLGWPEPQGGPGVPGTARQASDQFAAGGVHGDAAGWGGGVGGGGWSWVQHEEEEEGAEGEDDDGEGVDADEGQGVSAEDDSGDQMGVEGGGCDAAGGHGRQFQRSDVDQQRGGSGGPGGPGSVQALPQSGRPATRGGGGQGGVEGGALWQGQGWAEGADGGEYGDDSRGEGTSPSIVGSAMEGAQQEVIALVGYSGDEDSEDDSPDDDEVQQLGGYPPHDGRHPT